MEARAVKIWWDDRPDLPLWKKYTREASDKEHSEKRYIGDGFHECINFAFSHPDNRPAIRLYLPPGYKPRVTDPLLFFGTYQGQPEMGGYWVGAAKTASILPAASQRRYYQSKKHVTLYFEALANPLLVTPFIVPIKIDASQHLGRDVWKRRPVEVPNPGRLLKEAASAAAKLLLDSVPLGHRRALLRQIEATERLLSLLDPQQIKTSGDAEPIKGKKNYSGSGWHPDAELGAYAEEIVLQDQKKTLEKLSKLYPDCPKKPKHVAKSNPFADHDIESAVDVGDKWLPCYIEVKSTKSSSWATVMISEAQISLARCSSRNARHTFAIVEFGQGAKIHKISYKTLSEIEQHFILTPMKYRLNRR